MALISPPQPAPPPRPRVRSERVDTPASSLRRWLAPILLAGLLFRLWLWWRVPAHQPANDEVEYLQVARDLIEGRGWIFYESYRWLRAPLYPLFLAASLWLARGELRWAALPNIALSTATIALLYLLTVAVVRRKHSAAEESAAVRAGLIVAAFSAVFLPFATFGSLWMSETLFTALFVGALIALFRWARRPAPSTAALAGVLFGLATLTRSITLTALPLLLLWMVWPRPSRRLRRRRLLGGAICAAACILTIAPWTIRNWIAYDGFIPVETGLSYNLWVFNEPREPQSEIHETLESIPNPVERSAVATAKGLARLREDPSIILRRIRANWFYIWHINPIEDRFRQASYDADVPFGMFALGVLLDDALGILLLGAACSALVVAPRTPQKILLLGWLAYAILIMLLTHSEGRYRQFLLPSLMPYAAGLLAGAWWPRTARPWRALAVAAALFMVVPLRSYPYEWAGRNLRRGWAALPGDLAMERGDYRRAQEAYARAAGFDQESSDIRLKLGMAFDRAGQPQQAIEAYGEATERRPPYVPTAALLGDILRREGALDEARQAFRGYYTDQQALSDWAWENLDAPGPRAVDVGGGLDYGFVGGMYVSEEYEGRTIRWTRERSAVRLAGGRAGTRVVIRLAGPRADGASITAQLCVAGRCQPFEASAKWTSYMLYVPPPACAPDAACDTTIQIELRSPAFIPARVDGAERDAASADDRHLGLMVDYVYAMPLDKAGTTTGR